MKLSILLAFCAMSIFSLSSMKGKESNTSPKTFSVKVYDDAPKEGDNVADLKGEKITNFSVEEEFNKAGVSSSLKADVLAGRLCAFIYNPAPNNSNLCRYIVIYNCTTGTVYSVTPIP
jgi:hypothetical protein